MFSLFQFCQQLQFVQSLKAFTKVFHVGTPLLSHAYITSSMNVSESLILFK